MYDRTSNTRLFKPERQTALQQFGRRIGYLFALASAIAIGAGIGWSERSWPLALIVFALVFVAMAFTTWLVTWRPTPTVQCRSCGMQGWIDDLGVPSGACPNCDGGSFRYYRFRGYQPALSQDRISGVRLVELRRDFGLPWI